MLWANPAVARSSSWYLQFQSQQADERVVRQAIALELSELEIPNDPERDPERDAEVSLHIEITETDGKFLVVLWDRGELAGRRVASASGDARVVARRLGLVVAELARDLRDRRLRAARLIEQERRFVARRALVSAYRAQQRAWGVSAGLRTEVLPEGAFLVGPSVSAEFNDKFPLRLVAGLSWSAGAVLGLSQRERAQAAPVASKWQLEWGADWVVQPEQRMQLSAGVRGAASILHVGAGTQVDGIAGQSDTYSAQLGLRLSWATELGLPFWPRVELEAGRVLRPVQMRLESSDFRYGGWYVTFGISAVMFQ